jgi:hypothetical protein
MRKYILITAYIMIIAAIIAVFYKPSRGVETKLTSVTEELNACIEAFGDDIAPYERIPLIETVDQAVMFLEGYKDALRRKLACQDALFEGKYVYTTLEELLFTK